MTTENLVKQETYNCSMGRIMRRILGNKKGRKGTDD
jgi:hypothetical protein